MESDEFDQHADHPVDLREIDRAAAAPFVNYPDLPVWWPAVAGAWFALLLTAGFTDWIEQPVLRLVVIGASVAALGAAVAWASSKRGVLPSTDPRVAPPEIGRVMWRYYLGVAVGAVVVAVAFLLGSPAVGALTTFVVVTVGIAVYERAYHRAAARVRGRLE